PERLEPTESRLAKSDPEGEASVYLVPDHVDARRNIDRRAGEKGVCRHWIDPGRIAHVEMEVGRVAERHASRRAGERASQAHEDAILDRGAHEMVPGTNERHGFLRPADRERKDQAPAGSQLRPPRRGDVPRADREDDAIVRRVGRIPEPAVSQNDADAAEAGGVEMSPGAVHDVVVDVHGDERACFAYDMRHERRVVARARADLEDAQPGFEPELLAHRRHVLGLCRGYYRLTVYGYCQDRMVMIDHSELHA